MLDSVSEPQSLCPLTAPHLRVPGSFCPLHPVSWPAAAPSGRRILEVAVLWWSSNPSSVLGQEGLGSQVSFQGLVLKALFRSDEFWGGWMLFQPEGLDTEVGDKGSCLTDDTGVKSERR